MPEQLEITCCPHCGGELRKQPRPYLEWQYDCLRCSRGWKIDENGNWSSCFCADEEHITPAKLQEYERFWRKKGPKYPKSLKERENTQ